MQEIECPYGDHVSSINIDSYSVNVLHSVCYTMNVTVILNTLMVLLLIMHDNWYKYNKS